MNRNMLIIIVLSALYSKSEVTNMGSTIDHFFLVSCVATHIVKSQSNWIISMLQYTTNRPMVHEEPPSQFQTLQSQQPLSHLSQLSQNPIDPLQSLFWNTMNPAPSILDQRLAQVSNLMLSQSSQGPPQPTRFDFIGGHL